MKFGWLIWGGAIVLGGCYPRVQGGVLTSVAGHRTYQFECSELSTCVGAAVAACPYGYDLLGSGNVERIQPAAAVVGLASIAMGDQENAHRLTEANKVHRTQMVVRCRSADEGESG